MIGQRVYPPRLSSNLNSRETLSRVFFRRLTPTDSRSHQSGHIRMRHGPGFISPSRNLSCLATICRELAGRRSVTNQSDVQFRNQSDYPIPGVLSLYESDGFKMRLPVWLLSLSGLWLAVCDDPIRGFEPLTKVPAFRLESSTTYTLALVF